MAEIAVATVVTLVLILTRGYCPLLLQAMPVLYLFVVGEITFRHFLWNKST